MELKILDSNSCNPFYATFIKDAAAGSVEKWAIDMEKMTCTYFDKAGGEILAEAIPQ